MVGERPATREGAREFRLALEHLGATYVKLGQILSSRPDLLPDVYIAELGRLVDTVPPVPFEDLRPTIHADLGAETFAEIDPTPLAAASIAQIHPALLHNGRDVVVKVRRPGIDDQIALDLDVLRSTVAFLEPRSETAQLLQLSALTDELEVHLRAELDFEEEAANAELIGGIVSRFQRLHVPDVIRPYVSERVLVLERLHGEKVEDAPALPREDARELAREFFRAYVHQVTVEGVYHADPHRGNILLLEDGRLGLLDFGLLGRLDDDTRRNFSLLLLAVAQNRADDVADLILGSSLTTMASDEAAFRHELRRKLPRYQSRSLSGIRAGEALADLQRMALTYAIRLPPSFALVGKTLAQADSIARSLDPDLDPMALLEQDARRVMLEEAERQLEPNKLFSFLFIQLSTLSRLPRTMRQVVDRLEAGTLKVGIAPTDLDDLEHVARSVANRLGAALIVVGLLVSSALMARVSHTVSLVGFTLSAVLGLYMVWKIIRTPGSL